MMPVWAVIDAKLTERAVQLVERTGVVKLTVIGLLGIIAMLIAGNVRAETAHQDHVTAQEATSQQLGQIAGILEKLAAADAADQHYQKLMINIWLDMCISATETADRSRRTCQDIAAGRLAYVR